MAGDFVMVQHATPRKPEVLQLAAMLDIEPSHAFGLCVLTWMWFDEQTEDGRAVGATDEMLDRVLCRAGFSKALREVGWLQVREGSLVVPNFDRLMGESAKKRAKNTKRQQKLRRASVTNLSRTPRDKSATKEEKRREITPTPFPPCLDTEKFRTAWSEWKAHRLEIRKPLKSTQVRKQLEMLAEMGESRAVAMIAHTIEKGWQGLREPERAGTVAAPDPVAPPKPPPEVPHRIPKVKIT